MSMSKIIISLFLTIVLIMPANAVFAGQSNNVLNNYQYSTWLWDTSQIVTNPDKVLNFLSTNNVKTLYLQIDYNLKSEVYRSFIKRASMKNINVHALGGAPDWAANDGTSKQKIFFDWLTNFQKSSGANEKFNGVHLDVEPYLNSDYEKNMNKILENYQTFLLNALNNCNSLKLPLSIDIPFWFDEVKYNTSYGNGSLAEWIMENIKNVVIMAYRDSATGENGIINIVSKELDLGKQYKSNITVAVETQNCDEGNFVSFYEEGLNCMNRELNKVYDNYKKNSSFAGFAIHDEISWMKLSK